MSKSIRKSMRRRVSDLLLNPLRPGLTCEENDYDKENLIGYKSTLTKTSKKTIKQDIKNVSDINFAKYIENIAKYLGDKYCFVSGAFVVADPNHKLYDLLRSGAGSSAHLNLPLITASHRALTKVNPLSQKSTSTQSSNLSIDKRMYENKFTNPIIIKCKCPLSDDEFSQRTFEIVKWYQFLGIDNNIYIYFKLEDHPTLCWAHLGEAYKSYVEKKPNTSCVPARREDCKSKCIKSLREPDTIIINDSAPITIDTAPYGRVGDEMYIPSIVSDFLIENSNDIQITHSETDTVKIQTENSFAGGIKMKKRRKVTRKTKRKGKGKGRKSTKKTRRR